ncbi:MAG: DUF2793 domain-containing protein [Alteraurantiacibacter sp.]
MTDPLTFAATTPRHRLPNLFVAQAQKEFAVNEALARVDALLHPAVEGEADAQPASPTDGESWIVGSAPTGDWEGHAEAIASRHAGNWVFVGSEDGMVVFDKSAGTFARYHGGWTRPAAVDAPSGGTNEDVEARAAIVDLIARLVEARILPAA